MGSTGLIVRFGAAVAVATLGVAGTDNRGPLFLLLKSEEGVRLAASVFQFVAGGP